MFRALKTPYYNSFLEASVFTNTASGQTFALGEAQWSSAATSSSVTTLTAKETYGQQIIGAAQAGASLAAGGTVARNVTTTTSAATLVGYDTGTPSVDVGTIHYLNFASRDNATNIIAQDTLSGALHNARCRQGEMRIVLGRVAESSGTYSISYGSSEFSVTDNGTGDVTITLVHGFHANPCVLVQCAEANRHPTVTAVAENSFTVSIENASGAAQDAPFHFAVCGFLAPDVFHDGNGRDVLVNGRRPRLVAAKLTNQTTVSVGSGLVTSASGGTGVFDITFTQPFSQAPFVFALTQDTSGGGFWTTEETAATASTVSVSVENQAGAATLPDTLEILAFGFDSADVF